MVYLKWAEPVKRSRVGGMVGTVSNCADAVRLEIHHTVLPFGRHCF